MRTIPMVNINRKKYFMSTVNNFENLTINFCNYEKGDFECVWITSYYMSSESTDHKHHFCQRDHRSISHLFSSRLISKFYSRSQKKLKFYNKNLNSWPIDPKFCMMVESDQENFLMSWVWKNFCTMGQNLIFYENF